MKPTKKPRVSAKGVLQALTSALSMRSRLQKILRTFNGRRDVSDTLGYKDVLDVSDFRARFERNEIAQGLILRRTLATWRGFEVVEDEDEDIETAFEAAFKEADERLSIWPTLFRADTLSLIGEYSVILLGGPGEMQEPLVRVSRPEELAYFRAYAQDDAPVQAYDIDEHSPRYGKPEYYQLNRRVRTNAGAINAVNVAKRVHFTRVVHVAELLLDDDVFAIPKLRAVWNRLDDLEKVVGGGSEAFWKRADQGRLFNLDKDVEFANPADEEKLAQQIREYEHDGRREILARGMEVSSLGSDVADFASQVSSIVGLICAGDGTPQRVLLGSEQGKLAAKQDAANWDNQITDRQNTYAGPVLARALINRMIEIGALPEPALGEYRAAFSGTRTMDDEQRMEMATKASRINGAAGETVILRDEIRRIVGLAPFEEVASDEELGNEDDSDLPPEENEDGTVKEQKPKAAAKKGGAPWKYVHKVADRFRPKTAAALQASVQRSTRSAEPGGPAAGDRREGRARRDDPVVARVAGDGSAAPRTGERTPPRGVASQRAAHSRSWCKAAKGPARREEERRAARNDVELRARERKGEGVGE